MRARTRIASARPVIRRAVWPVTVCSTLCLLIPRPAYADPATPGGVPDPGIPPVASAPLAPGLPNTATTTTVPQVTGPFGAQLTAMRSQLEALGERLTRTKLDVAAAQQAAQATYQAWRGGAARGPH